MSSSDLLRVDRLSARWGKTPVLNDLTFRVDTGEFVALMGPNGSGKTTLLRCLMGFEPVSSGTVTLEGRSLDGVPTHRRGIGWLSQDPALFPRRTVAENIAYGLEIAKATPAAIDARIHELAELLRLHALLPREASRLSGGERQRVALARTLAPRPHLVLLDEPFANVDPELKAELRGEFRRVLGSEGIATLHVTHDREEGLLLADRVILLHGGRILREGTPVDVYSSPGSAEAAGFLGYNVVRLADGVVGVRPEDVELVASGSGLCNATVSAAGIAGASLVAVLRSDTGDRIEVRGPSSQAPPRLGAPVGVRWQRSVVWGPVRPPSRSEG